MSDNLDLRKTGATLEIKRATKASRREMAKGKTTSRKRRAREPILIRKLDLSDAEARARFTEILSTVELEFKAVTDPILESQRLSKEDFTVRINTR